VNTVWSRVETALSRGEDDTRLGADFNMWVFVLGDLFIFAVYFFVFMVHRFHDADGFRASQEHLNLAIGTVNTIVLLTSSQLVARAVHAARRGDQDGAARLIRQGMGLGVAFTVLKVTEWLIEIGNGHTLTSDELFMFYFGLTGVHLLHVLLGLVIFGFVLYEIRQPHARPAALVSAGATYWHMVDVVWVLLFAMLYLLR
jgi:nitric oxide reductase NorE protein